MGSKVVKFDQLFLCGYWPESSKILHWTPQTPKKRMKHNVWYIILQYITWNIILQYKPRVIMFCVYKVEEKLFDFLTFSLNLCLKTFQFFHYISSLLFDFVSFHRKGFWKHAKLRWVVETTRGNLIGEVRIKHKCFRTKTFIHWQLPELYKCTETYIQTHHIFKRFSWWC